MIQWKKEIKLFSQVFSSKEEFENQQRINGWEKILRPFEGQEMELWIRGGMDGYYIEIWCIQLKDFLESHLDNMPKAEEIVEEWLTTILLEERKDIDEDTWFTFMWRPRDGWYKSPDGGEHYYLEAIDPDYDG